MKSLRVRRQWLDPITRQERGEVLGKRRRSWRQSSRRELPVECLTQLHPGQWSAFSQTLEKELAAPCNPRRAIHALNELLRSCQLRHIH